MQPVETTYDPSAPVVRVSYCPQDAAAVVPLLQGMHDADLKLQEAGEDELPAGGVFAAFVSGAYFESHECRSAFNLAMRRDAPFVAVLLEDFPAMPALRMQLASVQAIRGFEYEDADVMLRDVVEAIRARASAQAAGDIADAAVEDTESPPHKERVDILRTRDGHADAKPADEVDVEANKKASRFPLRSKRLAIAAVAAAVVLLAVVFVVASTGLLPWPAPEGASDQRVLSVARPALNAQNSVDFTLTAVEDSSLDDFEEAVQTLQGRFDGYVGAGKYDLVIKDDTLLFTIPTVCLDGNPIPTVLRVFLMRPMTLTLLPQGVDNGRELAINLERESIQDVTVVACPDNLPTVPQEVRENPDAYPNVVQITLTPDYAASNAAVLREWGENLALAQDVEYETFWFWPTALADDGQRLFIFAEKPRDEDLEALAYSYSHDPLPVKFRFRLNMDRGATWEDVAGNPAAGTSQVSRSDLGAQVVILAYALGEEYSTPTEGDILDWQDAMKVRFDALGCPYAIGTYNPSEGDSADETRIVIALSSELFGTANWYALGLGQSCDIKVFSGRNSVELDRYYCGADTVMVREEGDRVLLQVDAGAIQEHGSSAKTFKALMSTVTAGNLVSFVIGDEDICSGTFAGEENGVYTFENLMVAGDIPAEDAEGHWAVAILSTFLKSAGRVPYAAKFEDYEFTESGRLVFYPDAEMQPNPVDKGISRRIAEIAPNATVRYHSQRIWVSLHLPYDENLAVEGLDVARKLFEAVAFQSASYEKMVVIFASENEEPLERARIAMNWNNSDTTTIEPEVRFSCMVFGKRADAYKNDFQRILETDEFWNAQTVELNYTPMERNASDERFERLENVMNQIEQADTQAPEQPDSAAS